MVDNWVIHKTLAPYRRNYAPLRCALQQAENFAFAVTADPPHAVTTDALLQEIPTPVSRPHVVRRRRSMRIAMVETAVHDARPRTRAATTAPDDEGSQMIKGRRLA